MTGENGSLTRYAWMSIAASVATITLKAIAYVLTGSVGLLSDALESIVNLAAALVALWALRMAERPQNDDYAHGFAKAEYFSSGVEGSLILVAAIAIAVSAADRLMHPKHLDSLGWGVAVSVLASLVNLVVARVLLRAGKQHHSIALEADGHHLMTDVYTSGGVLVGLGAVAATGIDWLDPLIAIAVAVQIVASGARLLRRSIQGLLDASIPETDRERVRGILDRLASGEVRWHALRTRQAGARRFVSVHILVPGVWSVRKGHELLEKIEQAIRDELPRSTVITHMEPIEDPAAWADQDLDR